MQRLAVLTTALGQSPPDPGLIYEAMKDRVHQPYRKLLVRIFVIPNNFKLTVGRRRSRGCQKLPRTSHPQRIQAC